MLIWPPFHLSPFFIFQLMCSTEMNSASIHDPEVTNGLVSPLPTTHSCPPDLCQKPAILHRMLHSIHWAQCWDPRRPSN
ncbi:hypothetical protein EDC04DRAFT_2783705 [Pisolithus marmoratus]|nr:hypothetical protein EDC04DRAFT_2783705 [Pisolithus marmoratus]